MPIKPRSQDLVQTLSVHGLDVRPSDEEREAVVARLRASCGEGRLSVDEFGERMTTAITARTIRDLLAVLDQLPARGSRSPSPRLLAGHVLAFFGSSSAMFATWQWNNPSILFQPTTYPDGAAWPAVPTAVWAAGVGGHALLFLLRTRRSQVRS